MSVYTGKDLTVVYCCANYEPKRELQRGSDIEQDGSKTFPAYNKLKDVKT